MNKAVGRAPLRRGGFGPRSIGMLLTICVSVPVTAVAGESGIDHLSLAAAISAALHDNVDLRLALLAGQAADAGVTTAGARPNPTLTLGAAGINPNLGIGPGSLRSKTLDSSVHVDQLFERGGKRALRIDNASALQAAAHLDTTETRRLLVVAVRQAYFDVVASQDRLNVARETAAIAKMGVDAAQKRLRAGDLAKSDVSRLEVDALRTENDVTQAMSDLSSVRSALAVLIGRGEDASLLRAVDRWDDDDLRAPLTIDQLLSQRADVRAAETRLTAAKTASMLAAAARTRDLTVSLQYYHYPTSATNSVGGGNSYGVAVQIPLFTRYEFQGEIRAALVAQENAATLVDRARSNARTEIDRQLAARAAAAERSQRYETLIVPAARRSADAAEFAFGHGAIAVTDVLDVRRTYRQTMLEAVGARLDLAKAAASVAPFTDSQK